MPVNRKTIAVDCISDSVGAYMFSIEVADCRQRVILSESELVRLLSLGRDAMAGRLKRLKDAGVKD